uniref:MnmE helical domain-containing protein n=1 Tax=Romanomermis culicivorax TaxID=13658 RepID=A0A915KEI7_ROMCU
MIWDAFNQVTNIRTVTESQFPILIYDCQLLLSEADIVIVMLETTDIPLSWNVEHNVFSESKDHHTTVLVTYLNSLFENFRSETASDMPEIMILVNKIDKLYENAVFKVDKLIWRQKSVNICWISCLNERGMDEFLRKFASLAELLCGRSALSSSSPLFTQQRHRHLVTLALSELDRYFQLRDNNLVIAADHLRRIIHHIGALTGQVTTEDILDCVFRDFCIGK